jgi:hypothetical protein
MLCRDFGDKYRLIRFMAQMLALTETRQQQ